MCVATGQPKFNRSTDTQTEHHRQTDRQMMDKVIHKRHFSALAPEKLI